MTQTFSGVLLVDKPAGMTSMKVVSRVKRALKEANVKKAGHTGTLDPMATGLLPVCIGKATRLANYFLSDDKSYEATMKFGETTDSYDADGEVVLSRPIPTVSEGNIDDIFLQFRGEISQQPPIFSALRVNGKRAYELAREGKEVVLEPRNVTIHSLDLLSLSSQSCSFQCKVSKGTYIRSLAHDIGETIGCGSHLTSLRRTQTGVFSIENSIRLEDFEELSPEQRVQKVLSINEVLHFIPSFDLLDEEVGHLKNGLINSILRGRTPDMQGLFRAVTSDGRLIALLENTEKGWKIEMVLG